MTNLDEFLRQNFMAMQRPKFWLEKARELMEAASTLANHERAAMERYIAAQDVASAKLDSTGAEQVDVECNEPNIFPIFLLYGYALENGFKAILIHDNPSLIGRDKIAGELSNHGLLGFVAEPRSLSLSLNTSLCSGWSKSCCGADGTVCLVKQKL